jgi:two-component system sensor histidine kinase KdpD
MARGRLRIYLGAAPGVGKTYAMLAEGWRRRERGTDVVIGFVEPHGRTRTAAQVRDLEIVPRRRLTHRGAEFEEMDVDAVLARRPQVALIDELAHTNVPGSRNAKRWQDIDALLDAGIDVISTLNIQHLESLNDVVQQITGVTQRETVPDAVVRRADQIELVDMAPEALRRRMQHGNIYPPDKVDAALANYFRPGNLTALRELALLWVADQVDSALAEYRSRHRIAAPWEIRERVAVALTGAPGADRLIRRAARIAARTKAELVGIHVERADGLAGPNVDLLGGHRRLLADLGGRYREVVDNDIGRALVRTAIAENATQLLIGASRRSRWSELLRGSVVNRIAQEAGTALDVHIIPTKPDEPPSPAQVRRPLGSPLTLRRRAAGAAAAVLGLPLLTALLLPLRDRLGFASVGFCYLLAVVIIGTIGGRVVAIGGAIAAVSLANFFFTEPFGTFQIAHERDVIGAFVFLAVAVLVSILVERTARRSAEGARSRRQADALATMAGLLVHDDDPLPDLLAVLRSTFDLEGVAVLRPDRAAPAGGAGDAGHWAVDATAGPSPPVRPDGPEVTLSLPLGGEARLAVRGPLGPEDRHVIGTFTTHLAVALESRRLRTEASQAAAVARAGEVRDAILAAVSHDLRTPLTSIKTAASSLLDPDLPLDTGARRELLAVIDTQSDRLNDLVGNLLDLGRLRADAIGVQRQPTDLADIVAAALTTTATQDRDVQVEVPDDLPPVLADPVLLERAIANLLANAFRYAPPDQPVTVRSAPVDRPERAVVELRVVDHGPGIPRSQRSRVFEPFQRLDDRPEAAGVGLGLAVARGFIDAMDGSLDIDETPGGGTTMIVTLPEADRSAERRGADPT